MSKLRQQSVLLKVQQRGDGGAVRHGHRRTALLRVWIYAGTANARDTTSMITNEVEKLMSDLNKKMGTGSVVVAADITTEMMPRFPTGSLSFDYVLGGGFPGNQWNELVGEPGHGKTMLALKTVATNQARDPNFTTVWVAAEPWVSEYAEMCGVDQSRVVLISTTAMEDAFDAVIKVVESKQVDCVVIDSLAALVPSPEAAKGMDEFTVGRSALIVNKFFRKVGAAMKRSLVEQERPILGIIINQWRYKIGVMYGDPKTTPGGVGKDYALFTRSEVKRAEFIEVGPTSNRIRVGQRVRIRVMKNKSAPPNGVASFDFYNKDGGECRAGEIDFAREIAALCEVKEVVSRKGSWYYFKDYKWQGMEAMIASIREEVDLREELERLALST
jgi:recombination protein RecA